MLVISWAKNNSLQLFSVFAMLYARCLTSLQIRNAISSSRLIRHMKGATSVRKNGSVRNLRSLNEFGLGTNTLTKYLLGDEVELRDGSEVYPKQLRKKHFVPVLPEKVPTPSFIAASRSCAHMLQLDSGEFEKKQFIDVFSGNELLPGLDVPYATVYGCHSFGQWFGQLGDGRALSIGDVYTTEPPNEDFHRNQFKKTSSQLAADGTSTRESAYGDHLQELQLKGCGRSPFSRGFDGRAVLRSSVRECLVSEAMYHLGVPTTRALSLIGTGMEIARPWYAATSSCNNYTPPPSSTISPTSSTTTPQTTSNAACVPRLRKFAPDYLLREPGAVLCRVSRSFLRFGQLELFAMRREYEELTQLADFVCFREFPELLQIGDTVDIGVKNGTLNVTAPSTPPEPIPSIANNEASILYDANIIAGTARTDRQKESTLPAALVPGPPERYVEMFRLIAQRNAALMADWLRVGYVQGNMNSDNTLLAGRTIDYGPYGWMERYDPLYQPFTTDRAGNFAFSRQPAAMALNVGVLGETTIAPLVQHVYMTQVQAGRTPSHPLEHYLQQVTHIFEVEYAESFGRAYDEVKRRKLGLFAFDSSTANTNSTTATMSVTTTAENTISPSTATGEQDATTTTTTTTNNTNATNSNNISADQQLWLDLELLMAASEVDFTILFRELGNVAELLVGPESTHSEQTTTTSTTAPPTSTTTTTSTGSSRAATMFVPCAAELSLFPNIPYATEQSQMEETQQEEAHKDEAQNETQKGGQQDTDTTKSASVNANSDSGCVVADVPAPPSGELEDLLLDRALALLGPAFYNPDKLQQTVPVVFSTTHPSSPSTMDPVNAPDKVPDNILLAQQWVAWLQRYQHRLWQDTQQLLSVQERRVMMDASNPKYVLRNWMAAMAYERSAEGDHSLIHELGALLEQPYDEQSPELQQRWYAKTPDWAQNLPGVTFMSCSS